MSDENDMTPGSIRPATMSDLMDVIREADGFLAAANKRIAELEAALRRVISDVNEYEKANHLAPNPGRTECLDSVAHAKTILATNPNS